MSWRHERAVAAYHLRPAASSSLGPSPACFLVPFVSASQPPCVYQANCSSVVAWCQIFDAEERVRKGGMNPAGKRQQEEEQNEATRQPE